MGVHGLWKLLESTGKPINPETLEGKILAVDISIWLNQAVKGLRDREGNSVQNAHLLTLFNRLCKLLFFRIKPVFVFDGEAPLLKKQTLALRRQRKEEMSLESKQTNEKLLRTFLKRQIVKAALGDRSQETLPSISAVRKDKGDDMYALPALDIQRNSSDEEEETEWEESVENRRVLQEEVFQNLNSVDIDSEEFASLPPEMKHEILKDMKEFNKRRRTMFHKPPEKSGEFSQYQLEGLLKRRQLNQRLEGVEREMAQRGAAVLEEEERGHDVETRHLASEDKSHYILIKGTKNIEKPVEKQLAVMPWSEGNKVKRERPEPLWRPLSECVVEKKQASPPTSPQPPAESSYRTATCPPSPRTLQAIQAAMLDSSSEDESQESNMVAAEKPQGQMSPRTLLAIQRALNEEEEADQSVLTQASQTSVLPRSSSKAVVVISSSDDELVDSKESYSGFEVDNMASKHQPRAKSRPSDVGLTPPDSLSSSASSEADERDQKIDPDGTPESLSMPKAPVDVGDEKKVMRSTRSSPNRSPDARQNGVSVISCGGVHLIEDQEKIDVHEDESDSAESFIEVSDMVEEESEEEEEGESEKGESEKEVVQVDVSPALPLKVSAEDNECFPVETPTKSSELLGALEEEAQKLPASNEWEPMDMEELVQLESSLQSQQSNLTAQKQQQERVATTVTGQMYLESQELLQLFGVPFFVAPMEAEAQCAVLERLDQTHGTITDDSDVWLFGARHVYKNFFTQHKYVEQYQIVDIQNQLGLDQTKMINLAYLLGSDYTEGLPGVGYVTGMEILNEFPGSGLEPLTNLYKWWSEGQEVKKLAPNPNDTKVKKKLRNVKLPQGFPNPAVAQAYLQPTVDDSSTSFTWGRPQIELLKDFCRTRFGWSSQKTQEVLQPVLKQLNAQQKQLRIDSFFRLEQQERQAIRSQRLRRAVTCLKRKEQEEEEEKEDQVLAKNRKLVEGEGASVSRGGFLRSQDPKVTQGSGGGIKDELRLKVTENSSNSSDDDSGEDAVVAMVTARPIFEHKTRGRGRRGGRGRTTK